MRALSKHALRACHPTFWSSHVLKCAESLILSSEDKANLLSEHKAWIAQFTGVEDPRQRIGDETGMGDIKLVKAILNSVINGSTRPRQVELQLPTRKVRKWLKNTYPTLFKVWGQTNVKQTGPMISKHFESKLTLNPELFKFFESLGGCKAFYEYDGFSLFFSPDDKGFPAKVQKIIEKVQELSLRQFGFKVVLKHEFTEIREVKEVIEKVIVCECNVISGIVPEQPTIDMGIPESIEEDFAAFARQQIAEYKNLVASVSPLLVMQASRQ